MAKMPNYPELVEQAERAVEGVKDVELKRIITPSCLPPRLFPAQVQCSPKSVCKSLRLSTVYRGINMTWEGPTHMATNPDDWTKDLEAELAMLAPDMWATQKRLEEKGFRVDGGNKTSSGWWLTAYNRNISRGSIKVQSDGTKIAVTVEG